MPLSLKDNVNCLMRIISFLAGRTRKSGVSGLYNFAVFCGLLEYLLSLIQKEIFELSNGWLPAHLGDQNQDTNLNSTLPSDMITGEV